MRLSFIVNFFLLICFTLPLPPLLRSRRKFGSNDPELFRRPNPGDRNPPRYGGILREENEEPGRPGTWSLPATEAQ